MKSYHSEAIGQEDFYNRLKIKPTLEHNTDGVWRGNLFEHKLKIDNTDKVLFQAIKYASRMRERGEKLPANLVLNDLNQEKAYLFKSADFLPLIEKVYFGAASKDNDAFSTEIKPIVIDYADFDGEDRLRDALRNDDFVRYHVDHTNILGLAYQFYKLHPEKGSKALKDLFLDGAAAEIRQPTLLADRIHPYESLDNNEFRDIMDALNPGALQRELGAFYTPPAYVAEMHKMLFKAIGEIPAGMDYLIIDRCAGVGNLEQGLPPEVLKHCVLSTLEPNEYQLLRHHFADDCAVVVPNTDALAYDIIPAATDSDGNVVDDFIREKVNDPNCVIILVENPPFSEAGSGGTQSTGAKANEWKKSFVCEELKKDMKGVVSNDLANLFIWSGFRYYLTKPQDSYILFSPTKYWRNQRLVEKVFGDGFLCNRKEFHAAQGSAMGCIWWKNQPDTSTNSLSLPAYDVVALNGSEGNETTKTKRAIKDNITIKRAFKRFSDGGYDSRSFQEDSLDGILCERDGKEFAADKRQMRLAKTFNPNIVGYMVAHSFTIDRKNVSLLRVGRYDGNGFYLRADNYIEKLPLFVAAAFPYKEWWKTDVYSKSYDGDGSYIQDQAFLKKCLIYTALTNKNKCRSLQGSDGRFYRNELCFVPGTLAQEALDAFVSSGQELSLDEVALIKSWEAVLFEAQQTPEYCEIMARAPHTAFGLWQVQEEINVKIPSGKKKKDGSDVMVRKHPVLNAKIAALDLGLKSYYQKHLVDDLFKYELLK